MNIISNFNQNKHIGFSASLAQLKNAFLTPIARKTKSPLTGKTIYIAEACDSFGRGERLVMANGIPIRHTARTESAAIENLAARITVAELQAKSMQRIL